MTGPLTFNPIPVPARGALANIAQDLNTQAGVVDTDFGRVQTWYGGLKRSTANESVQSGSLQEYAAGYHGFGSAWPSIPFVLPANAFGIWASISAEVWHSQSVRIEVYIQLTGPAVNGSYFDLNPIVFNHPGQDFEMAWGMAQFVPRSRFNANSDVVATPWLHLYQSDGWATVRSGQFGIEVFQ